MRYIATLILLVCSLESFSAVWTPDTGSKIEVVNPGVRSQGAVYFTMKDVVFSGCTNSSGAILWKDTNKNYSEIYSLLLAAKMADKLVRIYYSSTDGCDYPDIIQAYIL